MYASACPTRKSCPCRVAAFHAHGKAQADVTSSPPVHRANAGRSTGLQEPGGPRARDGMYGQRLTPRGGEVLFDGGLPLSARRGSNEASITLRELRANISPPAADAPAVFKNGP